MAENSAGKPYRPSNGSEGMYFDGVWCDHCARDAAFREDMDRNDGCSILALTFALAVDHPDYPKEWVYGADGVPKCTAFTTDPTKPVRCEKTIDMFHRVPSTLENVGKRDVD